MLGRRIHRHESWGCAFGVVVPHDDDAGDAVIERELRSNLTGTPESSEIPDAGDRYQYRFSRYRLPNLLATERTEYASQVSTVSDVRENPLPLVRRRVGRFRAGERAPDLGPGHPAGVRLSLLGDAGP